uniref:Uncharacterized protein n=1 Tax=Podarcis muralis TaxID=64176 RepID=A0A670JSV6_PODMU
LPVAGRSENDWRSANFRQKLQQDMGRLAAMPPTVACSPPDFGPHHVPSSLRKGALCKAGQAPSQPQQDMRWAGIPGPH